MLKMGNTELALLLWDTIPLDQGRVECWLDFIVDPGILDILWKRVSSYFLSFNY